MRRRTRTAVVTLAALAIGTSVLAPALASTPVADPTVPAGREVEPVVLTGGRGPEKPRVATAVPVTPPQP